MRQDHLQSICNAAFGLRAGAGITAALGFAGGTFYGAKQNASLGELQIAGRALNAIDSRAHITSKHPTETSFHAEMIIVRHWLHARLGLAEPARVPASTIKLMFQLRQGLVIVANAPCCRHCDNMLTALNIAHPTSAAEIQVAPTLIDAAFMAYAGYSAAQAGLTQLANAAADYPHAQLPAPDAMAAAASSASAAPAPGSMAAASSSAIMPASAAAAASSRPRRLTTDEKASAAHKAELESMMGADSAFMTEEEQQLAIAKMLISLQQESSRTRAGNTGWWNPLTDEVIPNADLAFADAIPRRPQHTSR